MAKKIVNQDIYNLSRLVDDIKSSFIPEENEATLNAGTFGYIGAIESKRLQTQAIMTGEMCNESFPSRARLERNVITHAITYNIENINALPGKMDIIMGIRQSDIIDFMKNGRFVIDRECPIYIENFEFHLEYDIVLNQITIAGNEKVFTAQYDMSRDNPSSDITNPYIASPSVVIIDNEAYIFINTIISQVEHDVEYKKVVTSNLIDNKTINFSFFNQLAYFEVHIIEPGEDEVYLTPIFEGAGIPNGVTMYCWYQYIDVDKIRVRFDRNSYMPGLNSSIEVLIKTTQGSGGNFPYKVDIITNFESELHGYRNLPILIKPASESDDGKDRKSKKELQRLVPAAALARGSLTNVKDLMNYFSMIDSDRGRIVPMRKIDNQRERVFYAYLVLKDINGNIIPANTINLKIPLSQMIQTSISDSVSPRYVLPFGSCFKLSEDGVTGEVVRTPIINLGLKWVTKDVHEGDRVDLTFSVRITSDDYPSMNCRALVAGKSSTYIESPTYVNDTYPPDNDGEPIPFTDGSLVSVGDKIRITHRYIPSANGDITVTINLDKGTEYIANTTEYFKDDSKNPTYLEPSNFDILDKLVFEIPNGTVGSEYRIVYDLKINEKIDVETILPITSSDGTNTSQSRLKIRVVKLTLENNPEQLLLGNLLTYHVSYIADKYYPVPPIDIELSRGVTYVVASGVLNINDEGNFNSEPVMSDLSQYAGFLYTNPYTIVINHYHLYSAFYMMCVNEYPYVHFDYINQKSPIQFVTTNLSWVRTFLGYDNDKYVMQMMITQSVASDMGLVVVHDEDPDVEPWKEYKVKLIALFLRNGKPYRYKNLELLYDDERYGYMFQGVMHSLDILDQENNIKVENVGLLNQFEEEYGFFNANTEVLMYALAQFPDTEGKYTRYDLDSYVPGLDGWSVTNVYKIVNGVNFYHNYAEIMGSMVTPYGSDKVFDFTPEVDADGNVIDPDMLTFDTDFEGIRNYFNMSTNEQEEMIEMVKGYYNIHDVVDITTDAKEEVISILKKDSSSDNVGDDGTSVSDILVPEGYIVASVPVFGYDYCRNEILVNDAIDALNSRKAYIDEALIRQENSFGMDYKHFNTYGPSQVFYIVKDANSNNLLDDEKIFLDRVNISMNFRTKLVNVNDTYTKDLIIKEIKDYMEDLNELDEIHIPELVTQINTNYSESIVYFEFLGFNDYGPGIQHLYKLPDNQVPIHVCPEFININNVPETVQSSKMVPEINIYISET